MCNWCEIRWPNEARYVNCALCREATKESYSDPTLTSSEATERANQHDFGWWLWDTGRF